MTCDVKHTKYQPKGEEYNCPKCGSSEFFCYESESNDCEKLHNSDILICEVCRHEETGSSFARKLFKKLNLVVCQHCNGKGMVESAEKR